MIAEQAWLTEYLSILVTNLNLLLPDLFLDLAVSRVERPSTATMVTMDVHNQYSKLPLIAACTWFGACMSAE
jgi:hypothetical protein